MNQRAQPDIARKQKVLRYAKKSEIYRKLVVILGGMKRQFSL